MEKSFAFHVINDPGHAWASVPIKILEKLDLIDEITMFSYVFKNRAYLEEDQDMLTFIKKLKELNISYTIKESHGKWSQIRNYLPFCRDNIELCKNLQLGGYVLMYNEKDKAYNKSARIILEKNNKVYLMDDIGNKYRGMTVQAISKRVRVMPGKVKNTKTFYSASGLPILAHCETDGDQKPESISFYDTRFNPTDLGQKIKTIPIAEVATLNMNMSEFQIGNSKDWKFKREESFNIQHWAMVNVAQHELIITAKNHLAGKNKPIHKAQLYN